MNGRDLIKLLLENDLDAEIFFEIQIGEDQFDIVPVNSVIPDFDDEFPMLVLSPEEQFNPKLN